MRSSSYPRRGGAHHLRLRRRRRPFLRGVFWVAALSLGIMTGVRLLDHVSPRDPNVDVASSERRPASPFAIALEETPRATRTQTPQSGYSGLLDPLFSGATPAAIGSSRPVGAAMHLAAVPQALDLPDSNPVLPLPQQAPVSLAERPALLPVPRPSDMIASLPAGPDAPGGSPSEIAAGLATGAAPLPVPRPSDLAAPAEAPIRLAQPAAPSRRSRVAATAAPSPQDNRNFFEKLFGVQKQQAPGTALAYAAPQDDAIDRGRVTRMSPSLGTPPRTAEAGTAIYDISARMVYLPNGERLEAHSGLGEMMDDPRYAHVRMKGVTPPHTYTLTEREALFHGVRAIRLNPVGGSGAIHGRAGLLAHTYLLGPRGDSNGCISFKDYDRFLQAFLRGEVRRITVVASL
ncbi:tlde1 domain-containing protein [Bosea sp. (in: a-proteobacteria)]|uniref:tlde1 domain-containing protein n=1 Tax=Bosea sp. (in: a-proteobacteria) TaxID=1871050 RepID=UPI0025C0BAF9|nr:tlde1 domain-containing protein [Bosea sp. (in: a-proteobacteria)]